MLFSFIYLVLRIHPKISLIIGPSSRYIKKLTYKCLSQLIRKNEPSLTWKHSTLIFTNTCNWLGTWTETATCYQRVAFVKMYLVPSIHISLMLHWTGIRPRITFLLPTFNISSTKCNYCYMIRLWVGKFVKFYKHLHVAIKWFFFPFNLWQKEITRNWH